MSTKKNTSVKADEKKEQQNETAATPTKLERFRAELKFHKQINPALRKIQVVSRALQNLKKKSIMNDYKDFLEITESNFNKIEESLLKFIPD